MRFYLVTDPVMQSIGQNGTLIKLEKTGELPPRFYLQGGGRKPAYEAEKVDAFIEARAKQADQNRAKNALVGQRLVAGRQAKAEERAAQVMAAAEAKVAKILEGRKPRAAAKQEGSSHDAPT